MGSGGREGIHFHESLDLIESDVVDLNGIPITSPARTVVDLGAVRRWDVERAYETGIHKELFTIDDVEAFIARVARRGRRGIGAIRPVVEDRRRWDSQTESPLEDALRLVVDRSGVPEPVPQYVVRDDRGGFVCRADFAYPRQRLLIELDSEAYHMDRITFRRDRSKQNAATGLGWAVLRYTWWDVHNEPGRIVADVEKALESSSGNLRT